MPLERTTKEELQAYYKAVDDAQDGIGDAAADLDQAIRSHADQRTLNALQAAHDAAHDALEDAQNDLEWAHAFYPWKVPQDRAATRIQS